MNPTRTAGVFDYCCAICCAEPLDFGCDGDAFAEGFFEVGFDFGVAAYTGEEVGLEDSWGAEGGGGEEDAERGGWPDDEVLYVLLGCGRSDARRWWLTYVLVDSLKLLAWKLREG